MEQNKATQQALEKHFPFQRVLIIIFVALFSGVIFGTMGYFIGKGSNTVDQQQKKIIKTNPTKNSTKISSKTIPQQTNPYAGWKQYCLKYEKSCFKYPPNWSFKADEATTSFDYALLTGPAGDTLAFNSASNDVDDNGCSQLQHAYIHKVVPSPHVPNLYIVEYGDQHSINDIALINDTNEKYVDTGIISKAPVIGNTGLCVIQPNFRPKNVPNNPADPTGSSFVSFSIKQSDLPTAELILESYSY